MHFVIFGLSVSSSWGNGHASIWRGLLKAMAAAGHTATFYEREALSCADARDVWECPFGVRLRMYPSFDEIQAEAAAEINSADVAMCTSYCPDGIAASRLILDSHATVRAFYDLDTPITLDALLADRPVEYLPPEGLSGFDLVLSYTGGQALEQLQSRLGARLVAPLYAAVDPDVYRPTEMRREFRSSLSYLGTNAEDRQEAMEDLFVQPARERRDLRFAMGGAQPPSHRPWPRNIFFVGHLPPSQHPAFFSSSRMTLNVTRPAMAQYGYCPSERLFEAAACGTPVLADWWEGLETFFKPGKEILRVDRTSDVLRVMELSDRELRKIADAARECTLREHTTQRRVAQLEALCEAVAAGQPLALTA
jgi:spore maturation protein CgeB